MQMGYTNLKELEGGGQGRIFLANDVLQNKTFILKTVRYNNEGNRRRLRREARLLREQESNLFVVGIETEFSYRDQPWLVLEYCSGGSIEEWIFDRKPIYEVVLAMQHAILGLKGIHDKNGFHGDVTPKNLLIALEPGNLWRIKLIDLGLGQTPNPESGSMTRSFRGTPKYIAPEVKAGDDYTWRADIFSLGIVFRELLTGSTRKNLFDFSPPPAQLTNLIDEMTAEDPLGRPEAYQVFDRLEEYITTRVTKSDSIQLPTPPEGSGWGWFALAALGTLAALAANANSYDGNMGRWRDSQGRFRSGIFS